MLFSLLIACEPFGSATPPEVSRDPIATAAHPESYEDTWMVVVHTSRTRGELPATWDALVAISRDGARPERLESSHFKGLLPCDEIVVAAGIPEREGALLLSEGLRVSGVDNYVKNAGAYVGPDPRMAEACSTTALPAHSGAQLAVSRGGVLHLPLRLPDTVHARALEGADEPHASEDKTRWTAALPVQAVGEIELGMMFTAVGLDGMAQECSVSGFSVLTEGQPHFSDLQDGTLDAPGCGTPRIHAVLSCDAPEVALVVPREEAPPRVHGLTEAAPGVFSETLRSEDSFQALYRTLTAQASELGVPLSEASAGSVVSGSSLRRVGLHLTTGEGLDVCGGADLSAPLHAITDAEGAVVMPFVSLPWRTPIGIAQEGGAWRWIVRDWTGSWALLDATGAVLDHWEREYCDCSC
ncbi:MAG: hypothetical protein P8R54_18225 [Myxococcota bacterium]|nr:hypothetical protein [Myxococcota bacterium]